MPIHTRPLLRRFLYNGLHLSNMDPALMLQKIRKRLSRDLPGDHDRRDRRAGSDRRNHPVQVHVCH